MQYSCRSMLTKVQVFSLIFKSSSHLSVSASLLSDFVCFSGGGCRFVCEYNH